MTQQREAGDIGLIACVPEGYGRFMNRPYGITGRCALNPNLL